MLIELALILEDAESGDCGSAAERLRDLIAHLERVQTELPAFVTTLDDLLEVTA